MAPAIAAAACLALLLHVARSAERALYIYRPEARRIEVRDPAWLPRVRIPLSSPPRTVSNPQPETEQWLLPLDEAIRIALANSRVVRILAGTTEQQAVFDPVFNVDNTFSQLEPAVVFSPGDGTDRYDLDLSLSKRFISGGQLTFELPSTTLRPGIFAPGPAAAPLSRQTSTSPAISLVQPLLQGGGAAVNLAPVVIARIEAERSFFQLKGSVQDLVQSVIQGYWALVFARTDVWARRQQVEQSQFAVDRAEARRQAGFADIAEVAQTRVALTNFRANLIAAEANLLDTEAALRNLLGLPPNDLRVIVPTTPPSIQRLAFDWEALVALAEQRRPDVIELKLVLEADQQQLLVTRNQALPSLDAVALYRWNGLEG
ncbi:MAG: TolC family protein, partial [Planctomycetes bacterium]|nr:TolC family protein [Planctomycetota bacterium]